MIDWLSNTFSRGDGVLFVCFLILYFRIEKLGNASDAIYKSVLKLRGIDLDDYNE